MCVKRIVILYLNYGKIYIKNLYVLYYEKRRNMCDTYVIIDKHTYSIPIQITMKPEQ